MLDEIENMVSKFFRNKKIEITILKFLSGRELLECKKTIDVVFLDIQMDVYILTIQYISFYFQVSSYKHEDGIKLYL